MAQADTFINSVGINTHLGYSDTGYVTQWGQIESMLIASGIRHIRDGLIDTTTQSYYDHLNALGSAGIHADLITSVGQTGALLTSYPSRVAQSIESFEGPSEYDLSGDPSWVGDLTTFQQSLYTTVHGNASTSQYPVLGPALTTLSAYQSIGNISSSLDIGSMQVYFAGHNPGNPGYGTTTAQGTYGSLSYNTALADRLSGNKPIMATETGYDDLSGDVGAVPSVIKAKYTLRTLLEMWNAGVARTYLYELADEGSQKYGILDSSGNPKPTYIAVKTFLAALADPGPSFSVTPLNYSVTGTSSFHQSLFEKRSGFYALALWEEVPSWDPDKNTAVDAPHQNVTINFPNGVSSITAATIGDDGNFTSVTVAPQTAHSYQIAVDDHVTLVMIKP